MLDRECLMGFPHSDRCLSSEAQLNKERQSLNSCVDVIAATSICYRKLDSFPICKCNRAQQPSVADLAVLRRTYA